MGLGSILYGCVVFASDAQSKLHAFDDDVLLFLLGGQESWEPTIGSQTRPGVFCGPRAHTAVPRRVERAHVMLVGLFVGDRMFRSA